jgi:hypothetical protein
MIFYTEKKKGERSGRDKKEISRMGKNYIKYEFMCTVIAILINKEIYV